MECNQIEEERKLTVSLKEARQLLKKYKFKKLSCLFYKNSYRNFKIIRFKYSSRKVKIKNKFINERR